MVATEAFQHSVPVTANAEENGKREGGEVRLLIWGDYLLSLRSMPLD